jgi:hypothetical protein
MVGKVENGIIYAPHTGKFATSSHRINFIMWDQVEKTKYCCNICSKEIWFPICGSIYNIVR